MRIWAGDAMTGTDGKGRLALKDRIENWAKALKRDIVALYFAIRDPKTPWHAKVVATVVVGYALSPIDLIPDFIPVLGYLDDVILLPLGIALVIRMIPSDVLERCRQEALRRPLSLEPKNWAAAIFIVSLWLLIIYRVYLVLR